MDKFLQAEISIIRNFLEIQQNVPTLPGHVRADYAPVLKLVHDTGSPVVSDASFFEDWK